MKKIYRIVLLLSMSLLLISCSKKTDVTVSDPNKLQVYVTFNALYEYSLAVGQDKVEITTIIPSGTEPHDFEPKAADIAGISDADVFVYNGFGMEAWAEKAAEATKNDHLTVVVASDGATPIENKLENGTNEHDQYDPHLWLSIKGAEIEVQNIADGFSTADPDNKGYYQINATNYISQLEEIYQDYNNKFSTLASKNFVTGHAAFNYFCRDFGLKQNSVEDVYAEGEPSTKQLTNLVDYCKKNKVTTIFAEKMASPEISKTLANEVGAEVETIYTMEGSEDHLSYLERIKYNCDKVYESMSK